jgi:ATP-dependent protease ClpP protease subunit
MRGRVFWEFRAAEEESSPKAGELLLYGPIGPDDGMGWLFDEVTPKQFRADLDALGDIEELRVYINSPGGDVFAGQAIHSILTRHPAHVTVYVDGLAASIASIVAMAGDTVVMPRNAMMMVHNPWTIGVGDAREFRKLAETLDQIRESMLAAYEAKTGLERSRLLGQLNAETWMTAEEAVELGFADEVEDAREIAAALVRPGVLAMNGLEIDLGRYRNPPSFAAAPRDVAPAKPTKRAAERALRDAGFSRETAKAVVARGWPEEQREASEAPSPERLFMEFQRLLATHQVSV